MAVSYNGLWKLLIDRDMLKTDLQKQSGISWTSITKMSKGKSVGMDVLMKVCATLECNIEDVVEFLPEDE